MGKRLDVYRKYKYKDVSEADLLLLQEVLPFHWYMKVKNNSFNKDKVVDDAKILKENNKLSQKDEKLL